MRCDYAYDDGAYVLGALAPGERASYERHLGECPFCREAVAEIAVLPGLLGRLDPADFADLAAPTERSRLPRVITAATNQRRRERRSRRWRYAGSLVAAASLAVVVGLGVDVIQPDVATPDTGTNVAQPQMAAMRPVAESVAVTAEVALTQKAHGTEVAMHCSYQKDAEQGKIYMFRLFAQGSDGTQEQIGSWRAGPGDDISLVGTTRFAGDDLVRLDLVRYDDTPLLTYPVP